MKKFNSVKFHVYGSAHCCCNSAVRSYMYTIYERLAMEKFLATCLINHMTGYMVQGIKKNPRYSIIAPVVIGFAKCASCCGLIFVDKRYTTKHMKIYTP